MFEATHTRNQQEVHSFLSSLTKMARNVHRTFHELFSPIPGPIKAFEDKKARIAKHDKSHSQGNIEWRFAQQWHPGRRAKRAADAHVMLQETIIDIL